MLRHVLLASAFLMCLGSVALGAPTALCPAPILADGTTATEVVFSLPGILPGDVIKARSDAARVDAVRVPAAGVVVARVQPEATLVPGPVVVVFRAKGARGKMSADVSVPTRPGSARRIEPAAPVAGTTPGGAAVAITLRLPETMQSRDTRSVIGNATSGSLSGVQPGDGQTIAATWTPPDEAAGSQLVMLTFADAAAPDRIAGTVTVPLLAEASLTLDAPADSQNILIHGETRLGPAKASPAGTVAFTLAIDPRAPIATLETTTPDGQVRTRSVELADSAAPMLAFVPGPGTLVADPARGVPLLVAALDERGEPVESAPPTFGASRGTLGVPRATGIPGIWQAEFTPPAEPGSVTFTATAAGMVVERKARLVAPLPPLTLHPSKDPLPHSATSLSVTVSGGGGVPALDVRGGRLGSRPRKTPDGTMFMLRPDDDTEGLWLLALPPRGVAGGVPATIDLHGPTSAPDTGPRPYTVQLADAAGLPVGAAPLTVDAPWADDIQAPKTTDAQGIARVWVTPPATGAEVLRVRAGGLPGGAVLGPAGLPTAPSSRAPSTWVDRAPAPEVAVAVVPEDPPLAAAPSPAAQDPGNDPPLDSPDPAAPESVDGLSGKTPTAGGTSPWLHLGLSGGLGGHAWSQDAEGGVAGPEDDASTAGSLPLGLGAAAIGLHAEAWSRRWAGLEIDLIGQSGDFEGARQRTLRGGVGLLGRLQLGGVVSAYGTAGAGLTPGFLVVYEDGDPDEEEGVIQRVIGGQLGAGIVVRTPRLHANLAVRELWAPWPVQTQARLDVGLAVTSALTIDLRTRYDARTMAFNVDGESVDARDSLTYLGLGVSCLLR